MMRPKCRVHPFLRSISNVCMYKFVSEINNVLLRQLLRIFTLSKLLTRALAQLNIRSRTTQYVSKLLL